MSVESLWIGVANHLWQCTLVLMLIFGLSRLQRDASARLQNALWWVALLKLLLPLSLLGGLSMVLLETVLPERGAALALVYSESVVASWVSPGSAWAGGNAGESASDLDPFVLLTGAWLAGALVLGSYWWCRDRALRGWRAVSPPTELERPRLVGALRGSRVSPGDVVVSEIVTTPAVLGTWRPRIVIPRGLLARLSDDELRAVVLHEAAHLERRDPLRGALLRVTLLGFYYFPPLWPLARRIHATTELACDEWVLRRGVARRVYARALAVAARASIGPAPGLAAGGSSRSVLRTRFERLRRSGRYRDMVRHRLAVILGIAVVAIASFSPLTPWWGVLADTPPGGTDELIYLAERDLPVALRFDGGPLRQVMEAIHRTTGVRVEFEGGSPDSFPVTLAVEKMALLEALETLAARTGVRYRVPDPGTLVVIVPHFPGVDGVTDPRIVEASRILPAYPEQERADGVEGRVVLQARIDPGGFVDDIQVLRAVDGHPAFTAAAEQAVRQWRYEPATKGGKPVAVLFTVVIIFSRDSDKDDLKVREVTYTPPSSSGRAGRGG